jgi:hypothetical protein
LHWWKSSSSFMNIHHIVLAYWMSYLCFFYFLSPLLVAHTQWQQMARYLYFLIQCVYISPSGHSPTVAGRDDVDNKNYGRVLKSCSCVTNDGGHIVATRTWRSHVLSPSSAADVREHALLCKSKLIMKISFTSMMDDFSNTSRQLLHRNNPSLKFSTGVPGISMWPFFWVMFSGA